MKHVYIASSNRAPAPVRFHPLLPFEAVRYISDMKKVLFLCSQNRLRSPTAEQVFSSWPGIEVASAGLNHDAETALSAETVGWADIIFVMERAHRSKLQKRFGMHIRGRVVCLNIPDKYEFMDQMLILRLKQSVSRFLS